MLYRALTAMLLGFILAAGTAGGQTSSPEEMNRQAYLLFRKGRSLELAGDQAAAFSCLTESLGIYDRLVQDHPEWNPRGVELRRSQAQAATVALNESLYPIPEGYIELTDNPVKEGQRYPKGRAMASRVTPLGGGSFEVKGFTVDVIPVGLRLAARCDCPDFKYRGLKFGYPCKHIWAVLSSPEAAALPVPFRQ